MNHSTARLTLAALLAGGGLVAFATSVGAQGIGVDELERMLVPTERKIERGKRVYQNQCAGCHGDQGKGNAEYPAEQFANPVPNFTTGEYRYGQGPIQVYNTITKGISAQKDDEATHPTYKSTLRYQQRWAVTHYVRSLAAETLSGDAPKVVKQARFEAKNGTCDPAIKKTMAARIEPKGEEQLKQGKKLYASQCASCHGDSGKGDGPAGSALNPAPRNFHSADVEWTNGTSPLNIFNTITNGVSGTAMASYASLSEEERWALTHYLRQWIPEKKRQEATEADILAVCRSLSAPEPPEPIEVDQAMQALIEDQPEDRYIELARLGPVRVSPEASADRGREIYEKQCASCHGKGLQGVELGPLAVERSNDQNAAVPILSFEVRSLVSAHAGGTYSDFASRASGGVHVTLQNMTSASLLTKDQWKDLHAYIASVEGQGKLGRLEPGEITVGRPETTEDETDNADTSETDEGVDAKSTTTDDK